MTDQELGQGCARGEAPALRELRRRLDALLPSLARVGLGSGAAEDVLQALEKRLLWREEGAPPAIIGYAAGDRLDSVLHVAATRLALNRLRDDGRQAPLEDAAEALASSGANPELKLARAEHADHFKEAFAQSLAQLDPRDRNLLRLHFTERLSIDAIGELFGVHRATAGRWLASARQRTAELTRQELAARGVSLEEQLVQSGIEISLERLLS